MSRTITYWECPRCGYEENEQPNLIAEDIGKGGKCARCDLKWENVVTVWRCDCDALVERWDNHDCDYN